MKVRTSYEQDLERLSEMVGNMGETVGYAMENAMTAWKIKDNDKAQSIMAADAEVNHMQKQIEQLCLTLLLRQTPVAGDLRRVSAALKMDTDLERIGDHAQDIAELSLVMPAPGDHPEWLKILEHMNSTALQMILDAMQSFRTGNVELAHAIQQRDDLVDDDFIKIKSLLAGHLATSPADMDEVLDWLMMAKYLERVADHAVNLADWSAFSVTGKHKDTRII